MKARLVWLALLSFVWAVGLMAWLTPNARGESSHAPKAIRTVAPPPTGVDSGVCTGPPCATIGYAISQSGYGDQINVASGWYTEHITMVNGVSIHGVGWDTATGTVITGNFSMAQPVVKFPSGIDATTVLSGVQIAGGGTGNPADGGSGIQIWYASPTIINTWVNNNTGYYGGGVSVSAGSPTFNNVPAWNNRAYRGGGFSLDNNAIVTMTGDLLGYNGTVWFNSSSDDGGGIFMVGVTATLSGLRIYTNTSQSGSGGGIYIYQTPNQVTLFLNDISGNSAQRGGGIYAYGSSNLQLWLNSIGNRVPIVGGGNHSTYDGGGAFLSQSSGLIQTNWFFDNRADGGSGGAMDLAFTQTVPTVQGNWFEGNSSYSNGGALVIEQGASPIINANTIVTNTTCLGAGISFYQSGVVTVTNNVIARNVSTCPGLMGGLQISQSPARVINNTIANNTGSGVWLNDSAGAIVINNIIYGNTTYGIERNYADTTTYTPDYNDVYLNSINDYSNVSPGIHDLSVTPTFVGSGPNLAAFYHLQATSPVSKTGSLTWAPAQDIDGEPRILCASMGADQLNCVTNRLYLPLIKK